MKCIAKNCRRKVALTIVDGLQPISKRVQEPVCSRHALLWHRQGKGSMWVFPPGETEATQLTEQEIIEVVKESGDPPLQRT